MPDIRTCDLEILVIDSIILQRVTLFNGHWFKIRLKTEKFDDYIDLLHSQRSEPRLFRNPAKAIIFIEKHMPLIREFIISLDS